MLASILICCALACVYVIYLKVAKAVRYEAGRKANGCGTIPMYKHKDFVFGLDYIIEAMSNLKKNRFLEYQKELYATMGCKTFEAKFFNTRLVFSCTDENMKAMSTTKWKDFGVQPIREGNGALTPLGTHGVSTTDGKLWEYSRDLIKPYFNRAEYSDLTRLDVHMDRLVDKIPKDGATVDLQPLFQRWFLDNSTDLLFGESLNSQDYPERFAVCRDMITIMGGLRLRLQMMKMVWLHRDKNWFAAVKRTHVFLDKHINKLFDDLAQEKATGKKTTREDGHERTDLLYTIGPNGPADRNDLRSQVLNVFFSSNETTSILMANVFYALARHPEVYEKLRRECCALGDGTLTWEQLRSMVYLRYVLNETHRVYPISLQTIRVALNDTTLPVGGGPDGTSPIFLQKGDVMHCNRYIMHRDPAYWGPDAEEFRPERWEAARPLWKFVPFGGGPRICPAHVLVDTECSYMIVKLVRMFKMIEVRDDQPYVGVMRAGPSNLHGVKVSMVVA